MRQAARKTWSEMQKAEGRREYKGYLLFRKMKREDETMKILGECATCKLLHYPNGYFAVRGHETGFMTLITPCYEEAVNYFLAEQESSPDKAETAR